MRFGVGEIDGVGEGEWGWGFEKGIGCWVWKGIGKDGVVCEGVGRGDSVGGVDGG